jgi:RNA polymerase subunit RPABC4/transcription elongation factor Spt4
MGYNTNIRRIMSEKNKYCKICGKKLGKTNKYKSIHTGYYYCPKCRKLMYEDKEIRGWIKQVR